MDYNDIFIVEQKLKEYEKEINEYEEEIKEYHIKINNIEYNRDQLKDRYDHIRIIRKQIHDYQIREFKKYNTTPFSIFKFVKFLFDIK